MSYLTNVTCPVCGETVTAPCELHGGDRGDYWNPPEPPEVIFDFNDFEFNCDCRENIEANAPTLKRAKTKPKAVQPEMKKILRDEIRYIPLCSVGFKQREARINYAIMRIHGLANQTREHLRDENGRPIYEDYQPLLEAYDKAVEESAEASPYHYDPPDPSDYYDI